MTDSEIAAAKRQISTFCVRGYQRNHSTQFAIDDAAFADEVCQTRCPYCGGFWMYSTDGVNVAFHVPVITSIPSSVQVREKSPETP